MTKLGDKFPSVYCETTDGSFFLSSWIKEKTVYNGLVPWVLFFSHPADFTPVCTTEISNLMTLEQELKELNLHPIGLSVDTLESHKKWAEDLKLYSKGEYTVPPIIADADRKIASLLGMLDSESHDPTNFIGKLPLTVRSVFILDEKMQIRAIWSYPAAVGRSWSEILRVAKSLRLSEKFPIATPEGWKDESSSALIRADISTNQAKSLFPSTAVIEVPHDEIPYIRFVSGLPK